MKLKIAVIIILLSVSAFAENLTDSIVINDRYLSKIKSLIDEETANIKTLHNEKKKSAAALKKAELELNYNQKLIKKLESKLVSIQKNLGFLTFQQQEITNRQNELTEKIRSANFYLAGAGETELLEALILSDEIAELAAGLQIISRVNTRLFDMVQELDSVKHQHEETKNKLLIAKQDQEKALAEKKSSLKELSNKKTLIKQLYKIAAEDEKIQREYVALLEKKQEKIENTIKKLYEDLNKQKEQNKFNGLNKNFTNNKRKLIRPVTGDIIETFGTKKIKNFKGVVHKKGIKIKPNESHVASVYDGVVMHTDTAWGLGWFVIVEHYGGYYTLYANMDQIKVNQGQKVHTGEVLGTIDIDQSENTPYLYFEIRIHDKAVDPLNWLSS